jgi:DNA-directed RNA polymerase specialized sigma24 family protein
MPRSTIDSLPLSCLSGNTEELGRLYQKTQADLDRGIQKRLRRYGCSDWNELEDLRQDTWLKVLKNPQRLRSAFDAKRGGNVVGLLERMAGQQLGRCLSRRQQRRLRELCAARREAQYACDSEVQEKTDLGHGLEALSPALRACYRQCLGEPRGEEDRDDLSDSARRQRRHRLKMKLRE